MSAEAVAEGRESARRVAAQVLDELLAAQQVRERDWAGVEWGASIDAPGMLAAYSGAGHELAWLDGDGRLSVIDPEGHVLETDIIVAEPIVAGDQPYGELVAGAAAALRALQERLTDDGHQRAARLVRGALVLVEEHRPPLLGQHGTEAVG